MKIYYIFLFIYFFEQIHSEKYISIENVVGCSCSSLMEFSIQAYISGFEEDADLHFYLDTPSYSYAACNVPQTKEGQIQSISCMINARAFPLFKERAYILPEKLDSYNGYTIKNWNKIGKKAIFSGTCTFNYDYLFTSSSIPKLSCDKNTYSFSIYGSLQKKNSNNNYLVNTEYLSFEYLIYTGDRIFYFDGKNYLFAKCVIGYDNNSNSYVMKCNFEGIDKKGIIYPTIVDDDTEKKSIKMDMSYTLNLGECKVEDEEKNHSSFTHITKLLLFVLILSLF